MVILGLIAFFALLILKLFPVYMEKFKVDAAMEYVANQPGAADKKSNEISRGIARNLDVNGVNRITESNFKDYGKVTRDKQKNKVLTMKYEIRATLFGDLDIVLNYDKTVTLKK